MAYLVPHHLKGAVKVPTSETYELKTIFTHRGSSLRAKISPDVCIAGKRLLYSGDDVSALSSRRSRAMNECVLLLFWDEACVFASECHRKPKQNICTAYIIIAFLIMNLADSFGFAVAEERTFRAQHLPQ